MDLILNLPLKYKFWLVNGFSFLGMAALSLFAIHGEHQLAGGDFASYFWDRAPTYALLTFVLMLLVLGSSQLLIRFVERHVYSLRDTMQKAEREGDLRLQLDAGSRDEIGQMTQSFNAMQGKFHGIAKSMGDASSQVQNLSSQLQNLLTNTSQDMHTQLAASKEAATTTRQLADRAIGIDEHTQEAKQASSSAMNTVTQGQSTLANVIETIHTLAGDTQRSTELVHKLAEESDNISKFLEVIRSISDQTNLLALNAAIEAARAGEAGRGFAVVAEEVRNLALKTHEATDEIETILNTFLEGTSQAVTALQQSQSNAQTSVNQADAAQSAYSDIAAAVQQINTSSQQIAQEAEQQSQLAKVVTAEIDQIEQLSQQTANNTEDANQSSEKLLVLAEELNQDALQFKV
ncbi:hypothetical protein R50073_39650 [Maricurvus nonylphenolicus]|uniref:methyl-accepting chemotaxis protein n=1 Tax=Maricurvus nonylphenolicus TaxID=1008307 RepID=UPI0036F29A1A